MLQDSLFESQSRQKTRKPLTVVISVAAHVGTIAVLALVPLAQTQAIPMPSLDVSLWAPKVEAAKAPEPIAVEQQPIQTSIPLNPEVLTQPDVIPPTIVIVDEPDTRALRLPMPTRVGVVNDVLSTIVNRQPEAALPGAPPAPLPPPPPPPTVDIKPQRIGGNVQESRLIHQVKPAYPPLAKQARVQGAVVLEAVINKEGTIQSLRVVTGHPLLTGAALDAVQQWRYRPTLLNGEPVEVITTITVTFTFQ
jgi:protein TonB